MRLWLKGIGIVMIVVTIASAITGGGIAYMVFIKAIRDNNARVDEVYWDEFRNLPKNPDGKLDFTDGSFAGLEQYRREHIQDSAHGRRMFFACVGGILLFSIFNIGSGLMFIGISKLLKVSELK